MNKKQTGPDLSSVTWPSVASATHGLNIDADQAKAWDQIMFYTLPDLHKSEIRKALVEAMNREEKHKQYHITVNDLIGWIKKSREGWREASYMVNRDVYFPMRERICGQIQTEPGAEEDVRYHLEKGLLVYDKTDVPNKWMQK